MFILEVRFRMTFDQTNFSETKSTIYKSECPKVGSLILAKKYKYFVRLSSALQESGDGGPTQLLQFTVRLNLGTLFRLFTTKFKIKILIIMQCFEPSKFSKS